MSEIYKVAYFRDSFVPFSKANLSVASAPVLYGLSVYTVFPVTWNPKEQQFYLFRLEDHFKRLQNSAKIMAFDDFLSRWTYAKFEKTMTELLKQNSIKENSLVRVSVFVDDVLRGTRMHDLKHSLSAFVYPAPILLPKTGARVMISNWRRTPDNAIPARAKINGSYVNAALMKHEAVLAGFDDAIALDDQGHITEGTIANLFIVRDGRLVTPNDATDILEGITRDSVLKLATSLHIPYEQRPVDRSELYLADELFFSGSSVQLTPIIEVDHRPIGTGRPGGTTKLLSKTYQACLNGEVADFAGWLTPTDHSMV